MYSGTGVCAGQAHWQSTTLWKWSGGEIFVGFIHSSSAQSRNANPGRAVHFLALPRWFGFPPNPGASVVDRRRQSHQKRSQNQQLVGPLGFNVFAAQKSRTWDK